MIVPIGEKKGTMLCLRLMKENTFKVPQLVHGTHCYKISHRFKQDLKTIRFFCRKCECSFIIDQSNNVLIYLICRLNL